MSAIKKATLSSTMMTGLLLITANLAATPALAAAAPDEKSALAAAEPAAPGAAPDDDDNRGDIVVTARKKGENILKTPVSVSALTSDDIAKRGVVSINDLANATPGINISNISSGRNDRSFQQISLRGFTPSTASSTLTATFIDGVPVASATALNSITDPERIEILKGPQSAYFGRNTFAGAINVVNKLPGNNLGGSFTASVGTRANYDVTGSIEGGLVPDALMFRVTGHAFSRDGSYTNGANGNQKLGSQRTYTGTALLVARPVDDLTIKAFGLLTSDHDGPSAQGQLSAYEVRSNGGALNIPRNSGSTAGTIILPSLSNCNLNGFTTGLVATEARVSRPYICGAAPGLPAGFSPAQNTLENALVRNFLADGSYRAISPSDGVQGYGLKRGFYHLHLNIDYTIGDTGITLSSLTGYNNEYYSELADLDNYDSSSLTNAAYNAATKTVLPYWDFPFLVERKTRDFSQEFRASYDKGPLTGVIGASYLWTRADSDLVSGNGAFVGGFPRGSTSRSAPQQSRTKGIFFGLNYAFTNQFKVSAEGRYQEDKIDAFSGGNVAGLTIQSTNQYGLTAGVYGPLTKFYSQTFKKFLPRVIAQFDFSPDGMVYASWSRGVNVSLASFNTAFLNGSPLVVAAANSINLGVIVQPETLSNYEIGLKGKAFGGNLRGSLAGYYAIWNNQQNTRSTLVLDTPAGYVAGTPCPLPYTCVSQIVSGLANSGKVIVKGIELDVLATPLKGLAINLAAAFNDSDIRSFSDPSISKLTGVIGSGFQGKQSPGTSKYSANLGVQYGSQIAGWDEGSWFIRGDASYKSRIYGDAANLTWIDSRILTNFRVGVAKGPATLELFVNNAFNNGHYTSIANNSVLTPDFSISGQNGYLNVGLPDLRTFGIKGGYRF